MTELITQATSTTWPLLPLFGWGIGLTFHAWNTHGRKPFTDEEIGRETDRLRPSGSR